MTDLARFQRTIVDDTGAIIASPTVTVRDQVSNALVSLFSDRAGASALSNPFTGTAEGLAAFHVAGGAYKVTATSGSFTAEWTWVGIGTSSEYDFVDLTDYVDAAVEAAGVGLVIDNGGSAIDTGIKGDIVIPFDCNIAEWTLLADQSGSIVFDIWKDTYANFPPVVGDSITASAKPTISAATKGQSSTLTGWTVACTAGDILRLNVDSVSTIQRVTIFLTLERT
jgi:hypothetical protein